MSKAATSARAENKNQYHNNTANSTFNLFNGSWQRWTPAAGVTPTVIVTGWPPAGQVGELMIEGVNLGALTGVNWPTIQWVKQDGSFTTAFPSGEVTLQAAGIDFVLLWSRDGGATIYGKVVR